MDYSARSKKINTRLRPKNSNLLSTGTEMILDKNNI